MNIQVIRRAGAGFVVLSLLALQAFAGTAIAGDTRSVFVGSGADGVLTSSQVSAGEQTSFVVTVRNTGRQTLNNITAWIGVDDNAAVEANPQSAIVPTKPVAFPDGLTATAAGCTAAAGEPLTCLIGSLGKGKSFTTTVILASSDSAAAQTVPTKAVAFVSEIGNDAGANKDTFAAEGSVGLLPYSCDSVTAYRAAGSKTVSTPCGVTEGNKQQSSVTLPASLTTITLSEGAAIVDCPAVSGLSCIGDAVSAQIDGDSTGDVVKWVLTYDVTGLNVNTNKLVVYHWNDETDALDPAGGIALKRNACKSASQTGCGDAKLDGNTLIITVQTPGNGKTRLLG